MCICSNGSVLIRREISLKFICEKVNFSKCDFSNSFHAYEWTYMQIIQKHDVQIKGNGDINKALHDYSRKMHVDTL